MGVEQKKDNGNKQAGTIEIFIPANGQVNGGAVDLKQAVQKYHDRLASPEFAEQMTGIFFEAKRAAVMP